MQEVIVRGNPGGRVGSALRPGVAALLLSLVVAACGGGGDPIADTAGAAPDTEPGAVVTTPVTTEATVGTVDAGAPAGGTCTITITGDREETWTFGQSVYSVASDHWMSEDELRGTVEALGTEIAGGTYEELVDRGDPIITFLSTGCVNPDDLIHGATVTHTNLTKSSDLPMGPGTYPIIGGFFDASGPAASVIAEFAVSADELYGTVAGSGSLEITHWDLDRIEGSLSFDAVESFVDAPREITVSVTFSYECKGWFSGC